MDFLTIYNYDYSLNNHSLLKIWLQQATLYNDLDLDIKVLSYLDEPGYVANMHEQFDFEWVKLPLMPQTNSSFLNAHNVRFKLFNLTQWENEYLFIDVDAFLFTNISEIVKHKDDKPWIGINHQSIPRHTEGKDPFLNSGVQVVSDPSFLSYKTVLESVRQVYCPGIDQALIFSYFKDTGYDYTHPEIGFTWNACAGYSNTYLEDGVWKCTTKARSKKDPSLVSSNIIDGETVHVNHYWHEFKPWHMRCDFYEQNKVTQ